LSEAPESLEELNEEQLREETARLRAEVIYQRALVDKLTHENAVLKRLKFAAQSERFSAEQRELLEETGRSGAVRSHAHAPQGCYYCDVVKGRGDQADVARNFA
jgi:hypothetical protein